MQYNINYRAMGESMSKSLYDSNEKYTLDAADLDMKTSAFAKELYKEFIVKGFKVREISQIMQAQIKEQEHEHLIDSAKQYHHDCKPDDNCGDCG